MITAIIPSKTDSNVFPCAGAIRALDPAVEILIVDDGLERIPGEARSILGAKPFVFARNVNLGIKDALGLDIDVTTHGSAGPRFISREPRSTRAVDGVVIMNDDAILQTAGGLSILAQTAAEHPEIGIVAATANNVGNRNQWPAGKVQRGAVLVDSLGPKVEPGLRFDPRMVCFVCVYIPKATLERVGLLDERFVGYGFDDDDYCKRIRDAGLRIAITDDVFVDHGSLKSTYRGEPTTPANLQQNAAIYRAKWGEDNWGRR